MRRSAQYLVVFLAFALAQSCTDLEELPPTAGPLLVLSPSEVYGEYPLEVSFVIKAIPSRGSIKQLIIDFGDGTIQDIKNKLRGGEVVISHTYDKLGIFQVVLSALDGAGSSQVQKEIITNDRPQIRALSTYKDREFLEPASDFLPGDVVYLKGICYDRNGISNVIISWGDGTFTETTECRGEHRYSDEGDFEIEVIVIDANRFAPYPLSTSAKLKIGVFAQAGSQENSPPDISFTIEDAGSTAVFRSGNMVIGKAPLEIIALVGVSDKDGSVQKVIVDWGDGSASVLKNPISKSGSREVYRVKHEYSKEGEFFITVIAEDNIGKANIRKFGPISTYGFSPVLHIEPKDRDTGQDVVGKTFSKPLTIRTKIISYDAKTLTNYVYVSIKFTGIKGSEILVDKLGLTESLDIKFDEIEISEDGTYEITYWIIPSDEVECAYCSSASSAFNPSFQSRCSGRTQFGGLSVCEGEISKLEGVMNSVGIKSKKSFQVGIQKR